MAFGPRIDSPCASGDPFACPVSGASGGAADNSQHPHSTGTLDLERARGVTSRSLSDKGCEASGRPAAVVGRARVVRGALVRPAAGLVHVLLVLERVRAPRLQRGGGLRGPRPRTPRARRRPAAWAAVTCEASAAVCGMGGGGVVWRLWLWLRAWVGRVRHSARGKVEPFFASLCMWRSCRSSGLKAYIVLRGGLPFSSAAGCHKPHSRFNLGLRTATAATAGCHRATNPIPGLT